MEHWLCHCGCDVRGVCDGKTFSRESQVTWKWTPFHARSGENSLSWKSCQIQVSHSVTNGHILHGHLEKSLYTDQNDSFKWLFWVYKKRLMTKNEKFGASPNVRRCTLPFQFKYQSKLVHFDWLIDWLIDWLSHFTALELSDRTVATEMEIRVFAEIKIGSELGLW